MSLDIVEGGKDARDRRILEFIDSEDFQWVLKSVTEDLFEEWSMTRDLEAREKLYYEFQALERIISRLAAQANHIRSAH